MDLLQNVRNDTMTEAQCQFLEKNVKCLTPEKQKELLEDRRTIHLFVNRAPMHESNLNRLEEESSGKNPMAFVKSQVSVIWCQWWLQFATF